MNFRILHYQTVKSTNDLALRFAREGASEGTVVLSEYQTRGRGRFNRRWMSPRGKGLLFSIILRPELKTSSASILTYVAAKAVRDSLNLKFHLRAKIKKPNDIMIGSLKIAGILTEASGNHKRLDYVVVGIGVNVNTGPKGLPLKATSVFLETNQEVNKEELLHDILSALVFSPQVLGSVGTRRTALRPTPAKQMPGIVGAHALARPSR